MESNQTTQARLALAEAKKALKLRRGRCWTKCGQVARFAALAKALAHQNLLSAELCAAISEECEEAAEGAKDEYAHYRMRHDEFLATLPLEVFDRSTNAARNARLAEARELKDS